MVSLTIVRYPVLMVPFAFISMAIFRLPLWLNGSISFYKLLGCGKNGTFDVKPDFRQWGIMAKHNKPMAEKPYGTFIHFWFGLFRCEVYTLTLTPLEGHGTWDGKKVFEPYLCEKAVGPIATLTRATIRLSRLRAFWNSVAPVAKEMKVAHGLVHSVGIGEIPWIKQATFSVWRNVDNMKEFAYKMQLHKNVIKRTRDEKWYAEEMFVRFKVDRIYGTINGVNPLKDVL